MIDDTKLKKLIKKGFSTLNISTELHIPEEKIIELRKEVELENKEEQAKKQQYEKLIKKYKADIETNPADVENLRNILAFTYFKAGHVEEARTELESLIKENDSYTAFRQIIHIEKTSGNLEDAKIWAYEALGSYPKSVVIREQLISIAKEEQDEREYLRQLKDIKEVDPMNKKNNFRLRKFEKNNESEEIEE